MSDRIIESLCKEISHSVGKIANRLHFSTITLVSSGGSDPLIYKALVVMEGKEFEISYGEFRRIENYLLSIVDMKGEV